VTAYIVLLHHGTAAGCKLAAVSLSVLAPLVILLPFAVVAVMADRVVTLLPAPAAAGTTSALIHTYGGLSCPQHR
jgi:hypothetical protein